MPCRCVRIGCVVNLLCTLALEDQTRTFCNPLNLDYRFQLDGVSRREAADPTMVVFNNTYWLFASKSGGYWYSPDLLSWTLIEPSGLPLEDYAPTVLVYKGRMYYTAFNSNALFATDDPYEGVWQRVAGLPAYGDPCLFTDENFPDEKVYMAFGCSQGAIQIVQLDPSNGWREVSDRVNAVSTNYTIHGWEENGDNNEGLPPPAKAPWIEGAWVNKVGNKYFLQFAAPATQVKSYADGVAVADHPLGPYSYAAYNPFSHKPTGFAAGAGHGSTFQDLNRQWWHIATSTISVRHMYERRLSLFPANFSVGKDGSPQLTADTVLGDYPTRLDQRRPWQLVSYGAIAMASSSLPSNPPRLAVDENIRTWWSAGTGQAGEYLQLMLESPATVYAMQVNFADQDSTIMGQRPKDSYRYHVTNSLDGKIWSRISELDRSGNRSTKDMPHDYVQLNAPVKLLHIRVTNEFVPGGARFSISDLRLFGFGMLASGAPAPVKDLSVTRDRSDPRRAVASWDASEGAQFYLLQYGNRGKNLLFHNYQVYGSTIAKINALSVGVDYDFLVRAVNAFDLSISGPSSTFQVLGRDWPRGITTPPPDVAPLPAYVYISGALLCCFACIGLAFFRYFSTGKNTPGFHELSEDDDDDLANS